MMAQTTRSLNLRVESLEGQRRVLSQQLDHTYDRLESLERLLRTIRDWFSPYTDVTKSCVLCGADIADKHEDSCPYPKWIEEVTYLIGPK